MADWAQMSGRQFKCNSPDSNTRGAMRRIISSAFFPTLYRPRLNAQLLQIFAVFYFVDLGKKTIL